MHVDQSIIEKIQKLQALKERAGTEEEAANAASKIAAICEKHNLDIGVAQLRKQETSATEQGMVLDYRNRITHIPYITAAIKQLFDVGAYSTKQRKRDGKGHEAREVFFGLKANVASACITFEYLTASVEALFKGWLAEGNVDAGGGNRSFRIGCSTRIFHEAKRLKDLSRQQIKTGSESQALMVLSNQLIQMHSTQIGLRMVNRKAPTVRASAFDAGYSSGGRVDLHGARTNRMLN